MCPMSPQVGGIYRCHQITRGNRCCVWLSKQIPNAPENISSVIEGDRLKSLRQWYPRLEICYGERITTDRNGERIQEDDVFILVTEWTKRDDNLSWSCLFKIKSP